jgi:aminoglycoside 3-N-acetyltransferase
MRSNMTVMVHSSLSQVGWTVGGPVTVIRALLKVLEPHGTLVMPAESPTMSDPANWHDDRVKPEWHDTIREHLPVFDPLTTPTTMGAIPEAFRTYPGTRRSRHPLVSVSANGSRADEITAAHALEFCEGRGTPFEKLYDLDACTLLLGVGFDRCTSLHYAESLVPARRTTVSRFLVTERGERVWVEKPNMAADNGLHFPVVGRRFVDSGDVRIGKIGDAESMLFSTRALVDFAAVYFREVLT